MSDILLTKVVLIPKHCHFPSSNLSCILVYDENSQILLNFLEDWSSNFKFKTVSLLELQATLPRQTPWIMNNNQRLHMTNFCFTKSMQIWIKAWTKGGLSWRFQWCRSKSACRLKWIRRKQSKTFVNPEMRILRCLSLKHNLVEKSIWNQKFIFLLSKWFQPWQ